MLNKIQSTQDFHTKCQNSRVKQFFLRIKYNIFDLFVFFLKTNQTNEKKEIVKVVIQLFQILSHSFDEKFSKAWGSTTGYRVLHQLFYYSKIIPFFKGHSDMYLIVYYIVVIFIFFILVSFIYQTNALSFSFSSSSTSSSSSRSLKQPIKYLSYYQSLASIMEFIPSTLFLPIFELLYSIFVCFEGKNNYNSTLICWKGTYIIHTIFGGLALVIFTWFAYIASNLLFEIREKKEAYTAKKRVKTDNILLFTKCLIILGCPLGNHGKVKQVVIGINSIALLYLAYSYTNIKPYYSYNIQKSYYVFAFCSSWSFLLLFIAIIINDNGQYNDTDHELNYLFVLCLLGNVLIVLGIVSKKRKANLSLMLKSTVNCPDELLDQLNEISLTIHSKDERTSRLTLDGYIQSFNNRCIHRDTPLKSYEKKEKDKDNAFYLIYHVNILYQRGLSMYPHSIRLRLSYAMFLYDKLYKRNQALIELENAKRYPLSLSEEFSIYRLSLLFADNSNPDLNKVSLTNLDDTFTKYQYKELFDNFKSSINKASLLYIDFWNNLLNPQHDNQDQLALLNSIGSHISSVVDKVHADFNRIINIKPYDYDVLLYYTNFVNDILNDNDLYQQYKLRLVDCDSLASLLDVRNLCHFNLDNLSSIDDIQFVIISAMPESIGVITHISITTCSRLGYLRRELVGNRIEMILPDMFIDSHYKYLSKIVNKYQRQFFDDHASVRNFKLHFVDSHFYVKTKTHYIIPMNYSGAYFPNDNHKQYFFLKILPNKDKDHLSMNFCSNQYQCHILTDKNLIIQNYSSNTINLLGLGSDSFNTATEITGNIKELSEDFLNYFFNRSCYSEKTEYTRDDKVNFKIKVLKQKYMEPIAVTWVKAHNNLRSNLHSLINTNGKAETIIQANNQPQSQPHSLSSHKKPQEGNEKNAMLYIKSLSFMDDCEGIIFLIEPIWHFNLRIKMNNPPPPLQSLKENITPLSKKSQKISFAVTDPIEYPKSPRRNPVQERLISSDMSIVDKVDKNYIPESNTIFRINPKKKSFFQVNRESKEEEAIEVIRKRAKEKYNNLLIAATSSIDEPSEEDEEEESEEYLSSAYSENSINDDNKTNNNKNGIKAKIRDTNIKESSNDYYKVNLDPIKYSIYNFKEKKLIDMTDYKKVSEMILKQKEEDNRINPLQQKQTNLQTSSYQHDTKLGTKKSKGYHTFTTQKTEGGDNDNTTAIIQKEIEKKEIKLSLKTESVQSTIYLFYFFSLLTCLLIVARNVVFLMEVLNIIGKIDESTYLIYSAERLQNNLLTAVYNIRELTLLNMPFYQTEHPRDLFSNAIQLYLNEIFKANTQNICNVTTSSFQLTQNQTETIDNNGGFSFLLNKDYSVIKDKVSFQQSIEISQVAIYHIVNAKLEDMYSINQDVFALMYNTMNSLYIGLSNQTDSYYLLFDNLQMSLLRKIILVYITCFLLLLISFSILRKGIVKVSMKNESYLSVFLEIGKGQIINSLDKCEAFSIRFFSDGNNSNLAHFSNRGKGMNDSDDMSHSSNKESSMAPVLDNGNVNHSNGNSSKKSKHKFYGRFIQAYIGLIIGALSIVGFDIYLIYKIISFNNETYRAISIYKSETRIQRETVLAVTLLREHVFDHNTLFSFSPLKETIVPLLNSALSTYQLEKRRIEGVIPLLPPRYTDFFYKINQQSICHYVESEELCLYYTEGSGQYGLNSLIIHLFDTVRNMYFRNYSVRKAQQAQGFKYNLTLYGTEGYDKLLPSNPKQIPVYHRVGPMYVLNSDSAKKLQTVLNLIIFPAFSELVNAISFGIDDNINYMKLFYIASLSASIAVYVILFVAVWLPFIKGINSTIYKTKNMLTIIPIEVLASIGNIFKLLDINHSTNNTNSQQQQQ